MRLQVPRLVRQADAHERASRALGAVVEGRGESLRLGGCTQGQSRFPHSVEQGVRDGNLDPVAGPHVEDEATLALIAVRAQYQGLGPHLDDVGFPGTLGPVRLMPVLVVHGGRDPPLGLDQVHPRDDARVRGGQRDGTRVDLGRRLTLRDVVRVRKQRPRHVHPPVLVAPLDRIGRVLELALDPFQIGEPRAIDPLVQHAGGDQIPLGLPTRCGHDGRGVGHRFLRLKRQTLDWTFWRAAVFGRGRRPGPCLISANGATCRWRPSNPRTRDPLLRPGRQQIRLPRNGASWSAPHRASGADRSFPGRYPTISPKPQ